MFLVIQLSVNIEISSFRNYRQFTHSSFEIREFNHFN